MFSFIPCFEELCVKWMNKCLFSSLDEVEAKSLLKLNV